MGRRERGEVGRRSGFAGNYGGKKTVGEKGWLSPEKWGEGEEGEAAGDKGEDAVEGWWVGWRRGGVSGGLAARGATGGCLWLLAGEREKGEEVGRSGGLVFGWDDWCCYSPAMAAGNNGERDEVNGAVTGKRGDGGAAEEAIFSVVAGEAAACGVAPCDC
ncbi:hypothetical protein HAX54_043316 [Datura stramonium]|uniref:Uncharacterized protein n=1 Tax=Datura stramonium TaxID=4076 RepID=A0ABS8W143_DATST|nr:hypothetical protein [Datura stramonium]